MRPFAFVLNPQPVPVLEELWGHGNFVQFTDIVRVPELLPAFYLRAFAK